MSSRYLLSSLGRDNVSVRRAQQIVNLMYKCTVVFRELLYLPKLSLELKQLRKWGYFYPNMGWFYSLWSYFNSESGGYFDSSISWVTFTPEKESLNSFLELK